MTTDKAMLDGSENRWWVFMILLLGATLVPIIFFPLSIHFHRGAASVVAISSFITFLGSGVHVSATGFFYADAEVRSYFAENRWRYILIPLVLILASGVIFCVVDNTTSVYLLLAYFVWQTYHYQKQNYGILSFVAAATDRVRPSVLERAILQSSVWLGIVGLIKTAGLVRGTSLDRYSGVLHQAAAWAFWIVPVMMLTALATSPELRRNAIRIVCLATGGFFFLPLFLFSDPVAAVSGYAVGHGLQYLVFMYFVGSAKPDRDLRIIGLAVIALVGGSVLALMDDQSLWGAPSKFVFGCYLGLVMSHFVVDAGIWKLRDPFPRKYMGNAFAFVFARGKRVSVSQHQVTAPSLARSAGDGLPGAAAV
jgi:hypothetical protein